MAEDKLYDLSVQLEPLRGGLAKPQNDVKVKYDSD